MVQFDSQQEALIGKAGSLPVAANDEVARKLAMLIEGECEGLGPVKAAEKYRYTRQRYFQIRCAFLEEGSAALLSKARGPKRDLPPHGGSCASSHSASPPRSRGDPRSDCAEVAAIRVHDQHTQC